MEHFNGFRYALCRMLKNYIQIYKKKLLNNCIKFSTFRRISLLLYLMKFIVFYIYLRAYKNVTKKKYGIYESSCLYPPMNPLLNNETVNLVAANF